MNANMSGSKYFLNILCARTLRYTVHVLNPNFLLYISDYELAQLGSLYSSQDNKYRIFKTVPPCHVQTLLQLLETTRQFSIPVVLPALKYYIIHLAMYENPTNCFTKSITTIYMSLLIFLRENKLRPCGSLSKMNPQAHILQCLVPSWTVGKDKEVQSC